MMASGRNHGHGGGHGRAAHPPQQAPHTGGAFNIVKAYSTEAKSAIMAACHFNQALLEKLYACFPKAVADAESVKSIADSIIQTGLPSGTLLHVLQVSDSWQVLKMELTVYGGERSVTDGDTGRAGSTPRATEAFTVDEVWRVLMDAKIKYGWVGDVTTTDGDTVDIGGLEDSAKG
jgi:hypothetical protein